MRLKIIIFCLVTTFSVSAQDNRVLVKLAPFSLADGVSFPTIQGGIEFALTPKVSWYNEFGSRYRTTFYEKTDTSFVSAKGFKAKTEVRFYFNGKTESALHSPFSGYYFAVNAYYIRDVHNVASRYYHQKNSSLEKVDNFGIRKDAWGTNLLLGWQISMGKWFMVDCYSGLGARYRDMSAVNKEFDYKRDELIQPMDLTLEGVKNKAEAKGGKSVVPNLSMGIRIAITL